MSSSRETFFMIFLLWQVKQKNPWLRSRCQLDYGLLVLHGERGHLPASLTCECWMTSGTWCWLAKTIISWLYWYLWMEFTELLRNWAREWPKWKPEILRNLVTQIKNLTPLTYCTLWRCLWVLPMLKGSELHNVLMWDILYHWGCCYRHQPSKPKCRTETIGRPYLPCALAVSAKRDGIKILKIMNKLLDTSFKRMIYYYLSFK